jgi:hypothetical protein
VDVGNVAATIQRDGMVGVSAVILRWPCKLEPHDLARPESSYITGANLTVDDETNA